MRGMAAEAEGRGAGGKRWDACPRPEIMWKRCSIYHQHIVATAPRKRPATRASILGSQNGGHAVVRTRRDTVNRDRHDGL